MKKIPFWKAIVGLVPISVIFIGLLLESEAYGAADLQVGTISEGTCWYENRESIRIASFNDRSTYSASKAQIEAEFERFIADTIPLTESTKISEMDLFLHCGGYGASLVAKVNADGRVFCLWSKFEKGKLSLRSLGSMSGDRQKRNDLCVGHKWGELIVGVSSDALIAKLQSPEWASMIKSISLITNKVYKIVLVKDYEFKEQEVIDRLQGNFSEENFIRYIEFNDYNYPIGESVHF